VGYAQKQKKRGVFRQHDDGFACVRFRGTPQGHPLGSAEVSRRPSGVPRGSKWEDRRIIPDYLEIGIALRETNSALVNGK
jgi:hypothetical protein